MMMLILLGIFLTLTYIMVAGFTGNYFVNIAKLDCGGSHNYCEHGFWWFAGIFWPLAVPFLWAANRAPDLANRHHEEISWTDARAERRRARELKEAEHKHNVALLLEKEIEQLERKAGIGL